MYTHNTNMYTRQTRSPNHCHYNSLLTTTIFSTKKWSWSVTISRCRWVSALCNTGWPSRSHRQHHRWYKNSQNSSFIRLIPRLHDTTGYQTSWRTGCIVYTNIQPVEQPVGGLTTAVEQPAASCKQTFTRLSNRLNNRLSVCLHDAVGCSTGLTTGCIV